LKRLFALFALVAFVAVLGGMAFAQVEEESAAYYWKRVNDGRAYLKVLDGKIIRYRKMGNAAMVKKLRAQKVSTIARMQAWKAKAEALEAGPPPPPPLPTAPPPPPVAMRPAPPAPAGLFGWGLNTGATIGYVAGNSVIVARGDLILADPLAIGPMLGLEDDAVAWKIGLGGAMGNDINDNEKKAIPLFIDGIINIPEDVMGVESYVGGGVNYVLYGTGREAGSYGGQIYYGIKGDIGLGGDSYAEIAYSIIRSGSDVKAPYSMKGVGINIGTEILL
jgi:hypothetical protein